MTTSSDVGVSGVVQINRRPSILVALFLAFFFILPAFIYLAVGGKDQTFPFNISISPDGNGARLLVSGQGAGAKTAQRAVNSLP